MLNHDKLGFGLPYYNGISRMYRRALDRACFLRLLAESEKSAFMEDLGWSTNYT